MNILKKIFSWLSRRNKTQWDNLNYGKPSTVDDELSKLNAER